ncbi:MAG: type II secretion system minor pseudopilin GspK [Proteobacteria bacterium]|nr:type II secretion system minor pseudopilin GspK [Pseudomonadota bacterium]
MAPAVPEIQRVAAEMVSLSGSLANKRGVALITVLLITALVSMMVVSMVSSQQIDIRRNGNIVDGDQCLVLAEGVVDWAVQVLIRDKKNGGNDSLGEEWAIGLIPTEVEGGAVSGFLEDMHGRFNLNNLVSTKPDLQGQSRKQFERMLDMCGLDTNLLNALIDWLDADSDLTSGGGAEDETYAWLETPYRTANSIMTSPSELQLVAGFDYKAYNCLASHITTLPLFPTEPLVNVNTASAFVLAALSADFSLNEAKNFVEERPAGGYASVNDFLQDQNLAGSGIAGTFLTVSSDYFLANAKAEVGNGRVSMYSLLYRQGNKVDKINKSIGAY